MSIDGHGILDSDLAHDIYNRILDLYDAGLEIHDIKYEIEKYEPEFADALEVEIFLAAAVKAFWEIGHPDKELGERLAQLLESGRSLALWASFADEALFRKRKLTLARLLKQIVKPRRVPRERKHYLSVRTKLFSVGDCISLESAGQLHKGVVCKIIEYRGRCEYATLVMDSRIEATIESFKAGRYYGRQIPSTIDDGGSVPAPHVIRLDHRMLVRNGNPFVISGHVELDDTKYIMGSFGGVSTIDDVIEDFTRTENPPHIFGEKLLPLSELIKL